MTGSVNVPWQKLSPEALRGLVEEFVTREGTEYGQEEFSLEEKCTQVMAHLRRGTVVIRFHGPTGSVGLFPVEPQGGTPVDGDRPPG